MQSNKKLLLGILSLPLTLVGCDNKIASEVYTDPATAPEISVDNSVAEVIIEDAEEKTQIQLKEIASSNLIGVEVSASANASANIKMTTKEVPGLMEATTSSINAAATASFKAQANLDVDGIKKYDKEKESHADIANTEAFILANVNAQITYPDSIVTTQDKKIDNSYKYYLKNNKSISYEKEDGKEEWEEEDLDVEDFDEFASYCLDIINSFGSTTEQVEDAQLAMYSEMVSDVLQKLDNFMGGKITASELVSYVDDPEHLNGIIANNDATNTVINVLNQVKELDLESIISYTTQGASDVGYVVNIEFNYDAFKTALNALVSGLKNDTKIGTLVLQYEPIINGILPSKLDASYSITINKTGMVEGASINLSAGGKIEETILSSLSTLLGETGSMFAYYSSIEYDVSASVDLKAKIGTNKVTVETLQIPTKA